MPESDKPLPTAFWSEPVPEKSMLLSDGSEKSMLLHSGQEEKSMLLSQEPDFDDWFPSFEARGLSREDVHSLHGTFSQQLNQELRTYEQMYQHVCTVQEIAKRIHEVNPALDEQWIQQHAVNTAAQAGSAPTEAAQEQEPAAKPKAKRLPSAEVQAKQDAIAAANDVWREAIKQRKAADAQWEAYVKWCHSEVLRLKRS